MANDDPKGFVAARHLGGATNPSTIRYKIAADGGRTAQFAKYAGDPCVLASGQYAARASADNSEGVKILGVIRAVYTDSGGRPRPRTFSQPTNGPVLEASVAGWVEVNVDPFQTFIASVDTTLLGTHIGQYVTTTIGGVGTAAGRSGFMLKVSEASNTASANKPYQIIGIAPTELDGLTQTEGYQDAEVIIANHVFNPIPVSAGSVR